VVVVSRDARRRFRHLGAASAAPALAATWHIPPKSFGPAFSASLFGILFGAPLLGLAGFATLGAQFGNNAASGLLYPTAIRARGVGWALGIGRFGSMLGPLIGGVLIGMKLPLQQLFLLAAAPMVAGLIASIGVARLCYQRLGGLHLDDLPASDTPDALVPDAPDPAGPA
jgi:MFS family permease